MAFRPFRCRHGDRCVCAPFIADYALILLLLDLEGTVSSVCVASDGLSVLSATNVVSPYSSVSRHLLLLRDFCVVL